MDDFEATVKIIFFRPEDRLLGYAHASGLGVRSAQDNDTAILLQRVLEQDGHTIRMGIQQGSHLPIVKTIPYSGDTIFFKIRRHGVIFDLSYSTNGSSWVNIQTEYVFEMSSEAEIFLYSYSTNNEGFVTQFYDFTITQ